MEEALLRTEATETEDRRENADSRRQAREEARVSPMEEVPLRTEETETEGRREIVYRTEEVRTADSRVREMTEIRETRTGIRMREARAGEQTEEECPAFPRLRWKQSLWRRKEE